MRYQRMVNMMPKAAKVFTQDGVLGGIYVECPCDRCGGHVFDSRWEFNGDFNDPTFTPSMLARHPSPNGGYDHVCHSFVRNGKIEFLSDCTHELAGQTIELPELDWSEPNA